MHGTTIGVFHQKSAAEQAVDALKNMGIRDSAISFRDTETSLRGSAVGSSTVTGGLIGAVVGAVLGWAVAAGVLPGLAGLIFAGPLATSLGLTGVAATVIAGAVSGLIVGAIIGALVGLGMRKSSSMTPDETNAAAPADSSEIIVTAHTDNPEAKRILRQYGADDVREYNT